MRADAATTLKDPFSRRNGGCWQDCWESILRLPCHTPATANLFTEAAAVVRAYRRRRANDDGIESLKAEVEDALAFVIEQITSAPEDADWRRIKDALDGAKAALHAAPSSFRRRSARATGRPRPA